MKIKSSPARKAFLVVNYFFLTLVMCISLFPLVHVFALSLSSNSAAQAGWVTILPVDFTLDSYQYILAKPEFSNPSACRWSEWSWGPCSA